MLVSLFNARGYLGKLETVNRFMNEKNVDIAIIQETLLKDTTSPQLLGHPTINLTKTVDGGIIGGRRANGGIMVRFRHAIADSAKIIAVCGESNYAILKYGNTTIATGYFPPPNEYTPKFLHFLNTALRIAQQEPLLITGDFNARVGDDSGDHRVNRRGRELLNWLDSDLGAGTRINKRDNDAYSTHDSNGGGGIPDLVLSKNLHVSEHVIHDYTTLGGSDHFPLTFRIATEAHDDEDANFERINVRKLADPETRDLYFAAVEVAAELGMRDLDDEADAESIFQVLKTVIRRGVAASCGNFVFAKKSRLNSNYMTQELDDLNTEISELDRLAYIERRKLKQRNIGERARETIRQRIRRIRRRHKTAMRALQQASIQRKKRLFEDVADNLGLKQNRNSLYRMAKCVSSRKSKGGSQLDPDLIDEHAGHFETTFGGPAAPTNIPPPDWPHPRARIFNNPQIRKVINELAMGKATGVDGIASELYTYGGNSLMSLLNRLVSRCYNFAEVPEDWKTALIVPIFKNKGACNEISNHRPIALTCVMRRIYERILLRDLIIPSTRLDDRQGGFREHRSCLDQVFALHETFTTHQGLHCILLDMRAAYDLVLRPLLWVKLERLGVDRATIYRITTLFDSNKSNLVIKNKKSRDILNSLGLLQGSSLSPKLFNMFINDLIGNLMSDRDALVDTHGAKGNCLFFADDGAIYATNLAALQRLLSICNRWAVDNHMKFAPEKCEYIGPASEEELRAANLNLGGQPIHMKESAKYLGVFFNQFGLDMVKTATLRSQKAKDVASMFADIGMNPGGWSLSASKAVYEAMIRPVSEYGLALTILDPKTLEIVERAQNHALRRIVGGSNKTSVAAMRLVLQIPPMEYRNRVLNAMFFSKNWNCTDGSIPAVRMLRAKLPYASGRLGRNHPERKSLIFKFLTLNPLKPQTMLIPHLLHPLVHPKVALDATQDEIDNRRIPEYLTKGLTTAQKDEAKWDSILNQKMKRGGVAAAIRITVRGTLAAFSYSSLDRFWRDGVMITLSRWVLGMVCCHQECFACGEELSRHHAMTCCGIEPILRREFPELEGEIDRQVDLGIDKMTCLDVAINHFRDSRDARVVGILVAQIGKIYEKCRNCFQKENGFWQGNEEGGQRWRADRDNGEGDDVDDDDDPLEGNGRIGDLAPAGNDGDGRAEPRASGDEESVDEEAPLILKPRVNGQGVIRRHGELARDGEEEEVDQRLPRGGQGRRVAQRSVRAGRHQQIPPDQLELLRDGEILRMRLNVDDVDLSSDDEGLSAEASATLFRRRKAAQRLARAGRHQQPSGYQETPVIEVQNPEQTARRAKMARIRDRPVGRPSSAIIDRDALAAFMAPAGVG